MDEICTIDTIWSATQDSDMQRPLSQENEDMCQDSHNPWETRRKKAKERFLRARPDGITHHIEKKIWYLLEFKRTSDIQPDYMETKENMALKQYENFMNTLRRAKNPGWTSEQLNFIVVSKTINEEAMDKNLDKIGINQKNKK